MKRRRKPETVTPFLDHIGAVTVRFDRLSAVVEMEKREELTGHLGNLYSALVAAVAESATTALLTHNFNVDVYIPMIKSINITYYAPIFKKAIAFATITEKALLNAEKRLQKSGKTDLRFETRVENEEGVVAARADIVWTLSDMSPRMI